MLIVALGQSWIFGTCPYLHYIVIFYISIKPTKSDTFYEAYFLSNLLQNISLTGNGFIPSPVDVQSTFS